MAVFRIVANTIITRSGISFDLKSPTVDMVKIEDIAYALSRICRFTGHVDIPNGIYSVATHSYNVSIQLSHSPKLALLGLLHDAPEAYYGDVSSPLKSLLPEYRQLEDNCWEVICEKFSLDYTDDDWAEVKLVDSNMFKYERNAYANFDATKAYAKIMNKSSNFSIEESERKFLNRFDELIGGGKFSV